ncbi:xaa-Arg dipeptidase-like [Corticium candelabrum]|uniref:xaa-Arg dipeptidase-like n=1 Tax=Corticium candelabrum TaxID=121492 RepID=UPI002E2660F6|nr:xaa-Arg dipeptidase-like [Corticium candelabrum]
MAEQLKRVACSAIDQRVSSLRQLSEAIWANPELNYEEHKAHSLLTSFLKREDFDVDEKYTLDTAFRARAGGDSGINVAFICEYDALPDIGHACGHNLIAEAGCAAGIGLKAALEATESASGRVTIMGTPAEEGGYGKIRMIENGCFKDVDITMMVHPYLLNVVDGVFIARDSMVITYTGKASHAAAFPWEGINALDAAVSAYNGISMLRQQMKPTWRAHGIISNGGAKPNIIPEKSELQYYLRAPTNAELDVLKAKVEHILQSAADTTGCQVEVKSTGRYSNLISNSRLEKLYVYNAQTLGVEFDPKGKTTAGSTDMGDVSYIIPTIHPMYSIGTSAYNHTREFTKAANSDFGHQQTLTVAKAMAMTAIDILTNPELLKDTREAFQNELETARHP